MLLSSNSNGCGYILLKALARALTQLPRRVWMRETISDKLRRFVIAVFVGIACSSIRDGPDGGDQATMAPRSHHVKCTRYQHHHKSKKHIPSLAFPRPSPLLK